MKKDLIIKEVIREVSRQGKMTELKRSVLRDVAIIIDIEYKGWKGYKIIGTNGYGFRYFYEKLEEVA